jgi:hypothetical protein
MSNIDGGSMSTPVRQISPERKAIYYGGMALIVVGILLFVSNFFMVPDIGGRNDPQPGEPDFWTRAQERHEEFGRGMQAAMVRALLGMGLMVVGGILMNVGAKGAAGSGLVLDPRKARQDLEPWSRMGGGVVQDALSEVDVVKKIEAGIGNPQPQVKVRCQKCQGLNDETAKFCNQCGASI